MPTVFFSWQSDRGNTDKNFIERALEAAIKRISSDFEIAEDPRDPLALDKDTQGVPASPNISMRSATRSMQPLFSSWTSHMFPSVPKVIQARIPTYSLSMAML